MTRLFGALARGAGPVAPARGPTARRSRGPFSGRRRSKGDNGGSTDGRTAGGLPYRRPDGAGRRRPSSRPLALALSSTRQSRRPAPALPAYLPPATPASSDAFACQPLHHVQVIPCGKAFPHDWSSCPFAHPTEGARRRDPRVHPHTGVSCPRLKKVRCRPRWRGQQVASRHQRPARAAQLPAAFTACTPHPTGAGGPLRDGRRLPLRPQHL